MRIITWDEISKLCQKLAQELGQCGKEFKFIYGIPRGGLPVGVCLSHLMEIRMGFDLFNPYKLQYITVDEINDSGRSLFAFAQDPRCTTVALFERRTSEVQADFVGEYINEEDYLIFPWEDKEKAINDMQAYRRSRCRT